MTEGKADFSYVWRDGRKSRHIDQAPLGAASLTSTVPGSLAMGLLSGTFLPAAPRVAIAHPKGGEESNCPWLQELHSQDLWALTSPGNHKGMWCWLSFPSSWSQSPALPLPITAASGPGLWFPSFQGASPISLFLNKQLHGWPGEASSVSQKAMGKCEQRHHSELNPRSHVY